MTSVQLRRVCDTDLDAVHELLSNMDVVRCMLLALSASKTQSEVFLNDACRECVSGVWYSHVRAICVSGALIGLCGLCVPAGSEQAELWYLLHPRCWGHGLTTTAVRQLLDFGFGELKLHRVWATCLPENPASARVLTKLGMRKEGRQVSALKIHGVWRDCDQYALIADEWRVSDQSSKTS